MSSAFAAAEIDVATAVSAETQKVTVAKRENTVEIADKCDVEIQLGKSHLPSYPVPEGYDTNSYFDYLCRKGLKERYGDPIPANIEERYLYEKSVIDKMGFPAYFLITWDFINWAKTHGVPTGPGRGSAAYPEQLLNQPRLKMACGKGRNRGNPVAGAMLSNQEGGITL